MEKADDVNPTSKDLGSLPQWEFNLLSFAYVKAKNLCTTLKPGGTNRYCAGLDSIEDIE